MREPWRTRITIEPGKRFGKLCLRGMRITVFDVLSYLAAGMTQAEILDNFPYLMAEDIQACLSFAADAGDRAVKLFFDPTLSRNWMAYEVEGRKRHIEGTRTAKARSLRTMSRDIGGDIIPHPTRIAVACRFACAPCKGVKVQWEAVPPGHQVLEAGSDSDR